MVLGQRKRGVILMIGILSLWAGGILIGGIGVIDQYNATEVQGTQVVVRRSWWFFGQAMIGPSIIVERYRNMQAHGHAQDHPSDFGDPRTALVPPQTEQDVAPPYEPGLAKVAEQGTLYTSLAGLLNLLAIIDALYCDPKRRMNFEKPVDEPAGDDQAAPDDALVNAEAAG